jgi:hypothetical protein
VNSAHRGRAHPGEDDETGRGQSPERHPGNRTVVSGAVWTGAVAQEYYRMEVDRPAGPEFRLPCPDPQQTRRFPGQVCPADEVS